VRRSDIQIGVEYARHGALAYGRRPSGNPDRVRFLGKNPNVRMVFTYRKTEGLYGRDIVGYRVTDDYHGLPDSVGVLADMEVGQEVEIVEPPLIGGLSAERMEPHSGKWKPCIVAPAEVHMTWQEHLDSVKRQEQEQFEARVRQAPSSYRRALREVVENAALAGYSMQVVLANLEDEWKRRDGGD